MVHTIEVRVFVSCPGDVTPEKEMVAEVCRHKNNVYAETNSPYRLKLLDWREISAPFNDGRPQGTINRRFNGYDIYFGILWMRFGTPTGAIDPQTQHEYESGTYEEFRIAEQRYLDQDELSMFLFFKLPRASQNLAETEQLGKLQKFQQEIQKKGWVHRIPDDPKSNDFNNLVHDILEKHVRQLENKDQLEEKGEFSKQVIATGKIKSDLALEQFSRDAPSIANFIPRTLTSHAIRKDPMLKYTEDNSGHSLPEIVTTQKRIVILGNAGSGKSIEMGALAIHFRNSATPYVPVYKRLNTYVDELISDFLPAQWQDIPENIALIILDGLDEVQPQHFTTAVRRLMSFSEDHPELRMVVSCRTNFYELAGESSGGTLTGFEAYHINEIRTRELFQYIEQVHQLEPMKFTLTARQEGYGDLVYQPFFLNLLLEEFKSAKNLKGGKASLLNKFIEQRILLDQKHFQHTVNLKNKKLEIIAFLQRIAMTMEFLGRNFISNDELLEILGNSDQVELIKHCTAFNKSDTVADQWSFEHNNIQEYLAAKSLKELPFETIKSFLSFNGLRIKPSWVNTLFFLMSIIDSGKRTLLIQWITSIEPEVLVRIEADKVDAETRFNIFKGIFNSYRDKGIWLRSNKFSDQEFARFPPVGQALPFALAILADEQALGAVRLNALTVIEYLTLDPEQLVIAREAIMAFIEANRDDVHLFYSAAKALKRLNAANEDVVARLMANFGERANQYVRAGLYIIINALKLSDQYIDYYLDGITFSESERGDRDRVNLMDESILLKEGLKQPKSYDALKKIFEYFSDPLDRSRIHYYDKNEVLKSLTERAIAIFLERPEILDVVYTTARGYARYADEMYLGIFTEFFEQTGTVMQIFTRVLHDHKIENYEKGILTTALLNQATVDYLISQYLGHNLTNQDLLGLYNGAHWHRNKLEKAEAVAYLIEEVTSKTPLLELYPPMDHNLIRKEKEQADFGLFFTPELFIEQMSAFFTAIGNTEISWDELWLYHRHDYTGPIQIDPPIFDLLVDFTRGGNTGKLDEIIAFTSDEKKFERYRISKIYNRIKNTADLTISESQLAYIQNWADANISGINLSQIMLCDETPDDYDIDEQPNPTLNYQVPIIWYLLRKLNLNIPNEKLLDFTLANEPQHNVDQGLDFAFIEGRAGQQQVFNRVVENLKNGIKTDASWRNNALYAIDHNLTDVFPVLLKVLANTTRSEYTRRTVLNHYFKVTQDAMGLAVVLLSIGRDELRWEIIPLIKSDANVYPALTQYLRRIMNNETENKGHRLAAARYLIENNDEDAFHYFADSILENADPDFDYYHRASVLKTVRNARFVPKLVQMLKMGKQATFQEDDFNRLDLISVDALFNIGLESSENLQIVSLELRSFIETNQGKIDNINYLYSVIDRMEYSFYLSQPSALTIGDAIAEIKKLKTIE